MVLQLGLLVYVDLLKASRYHSVALAAGINLGTWDAPSADVTHANSVLPDNARHQGPSERFLYSRSLLATGPTFQQASYQYSTQWFHTLSEMAECTMSDWSGEDVEFDAAGRRGNPGLRNYYSLYNSRHIKPKCQ